MSPEFLEVVGSIRADLDSESNDYDYRTLLPRASKLLRINNKERGKRYAER